VNMKIVSLVLIIVVGTICVSAQKATPTPPPSPKTVQNNISAADFFGDLIESRYMNRFFQFSLIIPKEYIVLNREELEIYSRTGTDRIKGSAEGKTPMFDKAAQATIPLIAISRKPPGSSDNSALEIVVVKQPSGAMASIVLSQTIKVMTETSTYVVNRNLGSIDFGGRSFAAVDADTTAFSVPLKQRTFITMQRDYALMITITYSSESGLRSFEEMLKSLKFNLKGDHIPVS